jgi:dihydrofolate reductase
MRLGLIDEYRLFVHPVVLGSGTPLFPALDWPLNLRLLEHESSVPESFPPLPACRRETIVRTALYADATRSWIGSSTASS